MSINALESRLRAYIAAAPTHDQLSAFATSCGKLNRLITSHQFTVGESARNRKPPLFTWQDHQDLMDIVNVTHCVLQLYKKRPQYPNIFRYSNLPRYLKTNKFEIEIKHNLSLLITDEEQAIYNCRLQIYIETVDRCVEKAYSLLQTIYDLSFEPELSVGHTCVNEVDDYEIHPIIHLGLISVAAKSLRYSRKFILTNVDSLRETYRLKEELSSISSSDNKANEITDSDLIWTGNQSDPSELIWALAQTGLFKNPTTGKAATQREVAKHFEGIFGKTINVMGLMQGRKASYKAKDDGLTFMSFLSEKVDRYIAKEK